MRVGPWLPRAGLQPNQQNRPPWVWEDPEPMEPRALCLEAGGRRKRGHDLSGVKG